MNNLTCDTYCLNTQYGQCVQYLGRDFPLIGIKNKEYYDPIIIKLAQFVEDLVKNNVVDIKCLYDDCGSNVVPVIEAVRKIVDHICNYESSQLKTDSNLYCLGSNTNLAASKITNTSCVWSTNLSNNNLLFNYNLSNITNNLPTGAQYLNSNIVINGSSQNGTTRINQSSSLAGMLDVPINRLPATAEIEVRVNTDKGNVSLRQNILLNSATASGPYTTNLNARDINAFNGSTVLSQKQYNEILASNICQLKTLVESLLEVQIDNCETLIYPKKDIISIISVHHTNLCTIIDSLKNIGAFPVDYLGTDANCGTTTSRITLQEALNKQQQDIVALIQKVATLEQKVFVIEQRLNNCCPGGGVSGDSNLGPSNLGGVIVGSQCGGPGQLPCK